MAAMPADVAQWTGVRGTLRVEPLSDGRHRLSVCPLPGQSVVRREWTTAYPAELIREIHAAKDLYVCDEIMREEDPRYVEGAIRRQVLRYVAPRDFAGKRILDFGCGSGASSMVLCRLLPRCEIVGVELEERLLRIARLRARHFGRDDVTLRRSPAGDSLPQDLGEFDYVLFSAVFEHLLPHERPLLLRKVWSHLRPGGVLFLNQTPYRWSPVEVHTTGGMPLINYLPDRAALWAARRMCRLVARDEDWATLLRRGIRGATVGEVLGLLGGARHAELLRPLEGDRIDIWFDALSPRHGRLKRALRGSLKALKALGGVEITPTLALALRKRGPDERETSAAACGS